MIREFDLRLDDGHTLHVYDTGGAEDLAIFWHHGTPNIGLPPEPLFPAADRLGLRWISYDRPGYGGSTAAPGRDVASAATYVARVAQELGIERFVTLGHSGGGPHALACAALLQTQCLAAVSVAGLAPYGAAGLDWFEGMAASGVDSLQAAAEGRAAKERYEHSGAVYDPEFTAPDDLALAGDWSWFGRVVGPATTAGPGGLIDDDLSYVSPWGFDPAAIEVPVLLLHGGRDRIVPPGHGRWLAEQIPGARMGLFPDDGHISVLRGGDDALEWLRHQADRD